jgi:uncharacterized protein with HEPN domain
MWSKNKQNLWQIATTNLLQLKKEVKKILEELD